MTNSQRLAARIRSLPKGRLVTLQVVVGADGEPLAWAVVGDAKLEGLSREVPERGCAADGLLQRGGTP